jgi:hypothetical protein
VPSAAVMAAVHQASHTGKRVVRTRARVIDFERNRALIDLAFRLFVKYLEYGEVPSPLFTTEPKNIPVSLIPTPRLYTEDRTSL